MNARLLIAALFLSSAALAGCGKLGQLEQPAPLYGAKAKADYEAKQRAEAEARERAKKADDAEPETPNPPNPNYPPLTQAPYATPVPGTHDPRAPGPQGSLPSPGTAPN